MGRSEHLDDNIDVTKLAETQKLNDLDYANNFLEAKSTDVFKTKVTKYITTCEARALGEFPPISKQICAALTNDKSLENGNPVHMAAWVVVLQGSRECFLR